MERHFKLNTYLKEKELFTFCNQIFELKKIKFVHYKICEEDWEDIKSEAIIKMFKSLSEYKKIKSSKSTYLSTVAINSIKNSLRKKFGNIKTNRKTREFKWAVRFPKPLKTIEKLINSDGNVCVEITPDVIDETNKNDISEYIRDFLPTISEKENKIFSFKLAGYSYREMGKIFFKNRPNRAKKAYYEYKKVEDKFKNYFLS